MIWPFATDAGEPDDSGAVVGDEVTGPVSDPTLGYVVRVGSTIGARGANQDRALVAGSLVAVADGVGGSVRGDAAAQVALGRIAIDSALIGAHVDAETAVRALVEGAHAQALHAASVFGAVESSSTLALVRLSSPAPPPAEETEAEADRAGDPLTDPWPPVPAGTPAPEVAPSQVLLTLAWVGDSPILVTGEHGVEQVTVAHTDSPDGHAGHGYALLRALGGTDATPDVVSRSVTAPCRVVLASDGLLDVPREVVYPVVEDLELSAGQCLAELLALVTASCVRDNTTIAVVDVLHTGERAALTSVL